MRHAKFEVLLKQLAVARAPINYKIRRELINYLIFFASIFALFSRSHSTFDFFLDNTDSLFALSSYWLIQFTCEMYSMWQMLQRFCSMVKLMDQKLEKVAKLFTTSVLLLNVSYLSNTIKCVLWRTSIFQTQANLSFSTVPQRTLPICLKYNNSIDSFFFIWESSFSPKNWKNTQ